MLLLLYIYRCEGDAFVVSDFGCYNRIVAVVLFSNNVSLSPNLVIFSLLGDSGVTYFIRRLYLPQKQIDRFIVEFI